MVALSLGYLGFEQALRGAGTRHSPVDALYLAMQLFKFTGGGALGPKPWELEGARFLAPGLTLYTAAKALAALFADQIRSLHLSRVRNHVIISGNGRKAAALARSFLEVGERVVLLNDDATGDAADALIREGALLARRDASTQLRLRSAGVARARYVIAIDDDDALNADVAACARAETRDRRTSALTCFVHIADPRLSELLQEHALRTACGNGCRIEFFDIYRMGARALLNEWPPGGDGRRAPHLLVVSMGRMGQATVAGAARDWWAARRGQGPRIRITVIDREAEARVAALHVRYPQLDAACELTPVTTDVASAEFERSALPLYGGRRGVITAAYVMLADPGLSLATALAVLRHTQGAGVPIVVRTPDETGLARLLDHAVGERGGRRSALHSFALINRTCQAQLVLGGANEILARAIHEDYVRHVASGSEEAPAAHAALVAWEQLPGYLKESNRRQALDIGAKLRAIHCDIVLLTDWEAEDFAFSPDEVELMAELEHRRWRQSLVEAGWRHAPGIRDAGRKIHPWLLPWTELPEQAREITRAAVIGLPRFLARAGFQVRRLQAGDHRAATPPPAEPAASYTPRPIDTSSVALPPELAELADMLAENVHDNWAKRRLAEGWAYGSVVDPAARTHPDLVQYDELPGNEREFDRTTTLETLKAILALGYRIQEPPARESNRQES
jgi:hypothetical protein